MGMLDFLDSKEVRLSKMKDRQDKTNRELKAEIMLLNSQKEGKQLEKELDDLRSETLA